MNSSTNIIQLTKQWLEQVVIGLNLCPFAAYPYQHQQVEFRVCQSNQIADVLTELEAAIQFLQHTPATETDTLLLIMPCCFENFDDYLDGLYLADMLIDQLKLRGDFQLASFHPDYQFEHTDTEAPENYTNRSPFPMFHLLREQSVEKAIGYHHDVNQIPTDNMRRLQQSDALAIAKKYSLT